LFSLPSPRFRFWRIDPTLFPVTLPMKPPSFFFPPICSDLIYDGTLTPRVLRPPLKTLPAFFLVYSIEVLDVRLCPALLCHDVFFGPQSDSLPPRRLISSPTFLESSVVTPSFFSRPLPPCSRSFCPVLPPPPHTLRIISFPGTSWFTFLLLARGAPFCPDVFFLRYLRPLPPFFASWRPQIIFTF